jgi:CheY-like chemotaxis protein
MMPGMDGGQLARRIAKAHPDMPVLLITGYTGPTNAVMNLPRLAKPFGQAEIGSAIGALFADQDSTVVRFPSRKGDR